MILHDWNAIHAVVDGMSYQQRSTFVLALADVVRQDRPNVWKGMLFAFAEKHHWCEAIAAALATPCPSAPAPPSAPADPASSPAPNGEANGLTPPACSPAPGSQAEP